VIVIFDRKCLESPLPDVPTGLIVLVVATNMCGEHAMQGPAKVAVPFGPDDKVEVVGHKAIGKRAERNLGADFPQDFEEGFIVALFVKDGGTIVAAIEDMVTHSPNGGASSTWHKNRVSKGEVEKKGTFLI
jgi:energy-converting hydrogenase Eha subunit B